MSNAFRRGLANAFDYNLSWNHYLEGMSYRGLESIVLAIHKKIRNYLQRKAYHDYITKGNFGNSRAYQEDKARINKLLKEFDMKNNDDFQNFYKINRLTMV